jgi:hypothetical protein
LAAPYSKFSDSKNVHWIIWRRKCIDSGRWRARYLATDTENGDLYADRSAATDNATSASLDIATDKPDASSDESIGRSSYSNADAYQ